MAFTLRQIGTLAQELGEVPIICAGDIFDRWNSPPELVNFALTHLPDMFAIPGQHDLPLHRLDLIQNSAFWTLVMAGKIYLLDGEGLRLGDLRVYGFGWGDKIGPPRKAGCKVLNVAVVHDFIWTGNYGYPGVSDESNLEQFRKRLTGYDAAVFGDNHKGFLAGNILNSGTLFRRKSNEIEYRPSVGILYASGKIVRQELDISGERMESVVENVQEHKAAFEVFLDELSHLASDPLNFMEAMNFAMKKCSEGVQKVLAEVMT